MINFNIFSCIFQDVLRKLPLGLLPFFPIFSLTLIYKIWKVIICLDTLTVKEISDIWKGLLVIVLGNEFAPSKPNLDIEKDHSFLYTICASFKEDCVSI